jgi:hypothetical protein
MSQTFSLETSPGSSKEHLGHIADKLEEFFGLNF